MGNPTRPQLSQAQIEQLSSRIAPAADLRLPAQMTRGSDDPPPVHKRAGYLEALLRHDPGVFLERHGELLTAQELACFGPLRDDYEVNLYLKLHEQRLASPTSNAQDRGQVKQRRLAYLDTVLSGSDYFSDDAMRGRAPWLYEQYIGNAPGNAPATAAAPASMRPGSVHGASGGSAASHGGAFDSLAQWFLRQQDELAVKEQLQVEKDTAPEEDSSSDESGEDEEAGGDALDVVKEGACGQRGHSEGGNNQPSAGSAGGGDWDGATGTGTSGGSGGETSAAEALRLRDEFVELMQQRFLAGHDDFDYAAVDCDTRLDEHWAVQIQQDAEDKYFDED